MTGTVNIYSWLNEDCPNGPSANRAGCSISNSPGTGGQNTFGLQLCWEIDFDVVTGEATLTFTRLNGFDPGWSGGQWIWRVNVTVSGAGITPMAFSVPAGFATHATTEEIRTCFPTVGGTLTIGFSGTHEGNGNTCTFPGQPFGWEVGEIPSQVRDTWDLEQDYAPGLELEEPVCTITETDDSLRELIRPSGPPEEIPVSLPSSYPAPNIVVSDECDPPVRTVVGAGCVNGSGSTSYVEDGEVKEELLDEDTIDDAIERATADQEWEDPAPSQSCLDYPAFILRSEETAEFAYQTTQVRSIGTELTFPANYAVTIRFYRRPLGVGGAWTFHSEQELSVTTDQATETTDWIDVPNQDGYETRPQICRWELVP